MPIFKQPLAPTSRYKEGEIEQRVIGGTGQSKRTFAVKGFLWWRVLFYEAIVTAGASDNPLSIAAYVGDPLAALDAFAQDVSRRKFRIFSDDIVTTEMARIGCSLGITRAKATVTGTWSTNHELPLPDIKIFGDGYVHVINQDADFTYTEDVLVIEGVRLPSYAS